MPKKKSKQSTPNVCSKCHNPYTFPWEIKQTNHPNLRYDAYPIIHEEKGNSDDATLLYQRTKHHINNFTHKWLYQFTTTPITVTNKVFGMNNPKGLNNKYLTQITSLFNSITISHHGTKIQLINGNQEIESYVIIPDYTTIITALCTKHHKYHKNIDKTNISNKIKAKIPGIINDESVQCKESNEEKKRNETGEYIDPSSEYANIYGYNHGMISKISINPRLIRIWLDSNGIYNPLRDLFENREFLSECILPKELLMIICNDYIRDTPHYKATEFGIYSPTLHLDDKLGLDKSHGFICHKLRDNQRIENVTFNTGLSLFGKYMNFQTSIKIGCDNESRLNNFKNCYSPYLGHFDTSREATTARRKLREKGESVSKDGVKQRIVGQIYCQNNYEEFEC